MSSPKLPPPVVSRNQSQSSRRSIGSVRQTTAAPTPPVEIIALEHPAVASTQQTATRLPPNSTASDEHASDEISLKPGSYFDYVRYAASGSPVGALAAMQILDLESKSKSLIAKGKIDVIVLDIREDGTYLSPKCFGKTESIRRYLKSASPENLSTKDIEGLIQPASTLKRVLEEPKTPEIAVRLVLVEDLSPATVEALGSALDLNPSFFSEHLLGAQTAFGEKCLGRVKECARPKDHFSWLWKRNISQDRYMGYVDCANISRPHMLVNPHITYEMTQRLGLVIDIGIANERMSFLTKADDHCQTGIFLFDYPDSVHILDGDWFDLSTHNRSAMNRALSFKEFTRPSQPTNKPFNSERSTRNWFVARLADTMDGNGNKDYSTRGNSTGAKDIRSFLYPILYQIIYDWWDTLEAIEIFLDKTDSYLTTSDKPKDNLELVAIYRNLRKLLFEGSEDIRVVMKTIGEKAFDGRALDEEILGRLKDEPQYLLNRIESLKDRIEVISNAFVSTMSILESKKAISEAESISRLTELAFFFIPLSFATSVFGMQIQGWSENYRPYMWPLVSGLLVLGAYVFRYAVHRVRYRWLKTRAGNNQRTDFPLFRIPGFRRRNVQISRLPPEEPASNLLILTWFINWYLFKVICTVLSVVVIAVVWTNPSPIAAKISVTVIVPPLFFADDIARSLRRLRILRRRWIPRSADVHVFM